MAMVEVLINLKKTNLLNKYLSNIKVILITYLLPMHDYLVL